MKIINDPVYGFITIRSGLIFDLIEHPWFQRLRYIRQLGLAELIYPGALHTRFHHALGSLHLMGKMMEELRARGVEISHAESEAAQIAILLHDIGHGPFSHALEKTLIPSVRHESLSYLFLKKLNIEFNGGLDLAMKIFRDGYSRKFFHQLVSSQLDIDRLDYLTRDCFFTGVMEGMIGVDRIMSMINVVNDRIVVEEKGIHTVESFLQARRLMYWQVYLHKTSVSAERLLVNLIERAQYLYRAGEPLPCSEALQFFLKHSFTGEDFQEKPLLIKTFGQLDDHDIWGAIKLWQNHRDKIMSTLCKMLLTRNLFKITLTTEAIKKTQVEKIRSKIVKKYDVLRNDAAYLFSHGVVSNEAYLPERDTINIHMRSGKVLDIAEASDLQSIKALSKIVKKNYLCWPRGLSL
jgi:HD superfamily phosphohydrolase